MSQAEQRQIQAVFLQGEITAGFLTGTGAHGLQTQGHALWEALQPTMGQACTSIFDPHQ
jgi:hypothetical protein